MYDVLKSISSQSRIVACDDVAWRISIGDAGTWEP